MNFVFDQIFLVFLFCFVSTIIFGMYAARPSKKQSKDLNEWGLGGRSFGPWLTWFLLGGDFYTAYTVIAVPALVFTVGAYGFFALPYTILVYPFIFLVMPILWRYANEYKHITAADIVHHKYQSRPLEFVIALTGIVATMPYIALQVVGMSVIFGQLGLTGYLPVIFSFLVLGAYTYSSGLKAPAFIAFIKDIMIYIVVIAAVALIPLKLGGYERIFTLAKDVFSTKENADILLGPSQYFAYATLALGSALGAFMYPHTLTGVLAAKNEDTVKLNAIFLPAYTILLGLLALLGYMAYAAYIQVDNANDIVPVLLRELFPQWFVGFSFAAITIGALIPASVMSIGASNLFTRNIWRTYINENLTPGQEARVAKIGSLLIMGGALLIIMYLPLKFALNLQLLGSICILQTLPSLIFGFFTNIYRGKALFVGWVVGIVTGLSLVYANDFMPLHHILWDGEQVTFYIGLTAFLLNATVATLLSFVLPDKKPRPTAAS